MGVIEEGLVKVQDGVASAWCQKNYELSYWKFGGPTKRCLFGWANFVDWGNAYKQGGPLANFLNEFGDDYFLQEFQNRNVMVVNDHPDTTVNDIIWFLDEAIAAAHEEGL